MSTNSTAHHARLTFPPIPPKRFFTIGEVAKLVHAKPHTLRHWENCLGEAFSVNRNGKRRYYGQEDILLLQQIHRLRVEQGLTLSGIKTRLSQKKPAGESSLERKIIINKIKAIIDILWNTGRGAAW